MRILHVNKFFDLRGGAEIYMHALMERQRQAGHEVHALSSRSPDNVPSADESRFVGRYDFSKSEGPLRDARKAASFVWNPEAHREMKRAIDELQPDVVHLHNIYHHLSTSILKPIRASGLPCVQTLHDYKLACPNYKMFTEGSPCERCRGGRYLEAVRHRCLFYGMPGNLLAAFEMGLAKFTQSYERTVHVFICPSKFMADKMIEWGEPPSKMRVIPNPAESSGLLASRDGDYILVAGRLSEEKGIETLVRAAARIPEIRLRIAGSGPEESRLKTLVASLEAKNIEFLGFLRKTRLEEERRHAMALAVPSVWYENAPLAVLEAMSEGLPILASRIGGLPEMVVENENGSLVEPRDVDAWSSALKKFADLPSEKREAMSEKSRSMFTQRHSWDGHLAAVYEAYGFAGAKL